MATATATGFVSSLSGLPDQVLLAHTRSLVLHEQALQLAVLDHLREIQARHLHLRLGCSSLFDYAVRELGYSEGAAWRRIKAMRLCAETAGTRERLQDGSLTLSAAAQLQNTFDLQQRAATAAAHPASASAAPAAPELLPGGTGTTPEAASGAEAAAPARPAPALDAAQRQELVAQASGKSTREVKQMLAGVAPELAPPAERMRALGEDRWELKVVIDAACQRGIEQLRALLSHVDPHLTLGQLVERLVQDGLQRYDPGRPRRGRGGGRQEAGAGQAPELSPRHAAEPQAQEGPAGGAASPAKRSAQEQPGMPPAMAGTSAAGSTPAPAARSAEQPARSFGSDTLDGGCGEAPAARSAEERAPGIGGAGTSAVAALPAPPAGPETCGVSTPARARPAAVAPPAPGAATSAAKATAGRGARAAVPSPRPTPPADQSLPTATAGVDRGRSAPSPAKPPGVDRGRSVPSPAKPVAVAQRDGRSRVRPRAAGAAGGGARPEAAGRPHRAHRSRYIPAPVRREVWRRDGGCCSYVDPHSGRRCGSRFLLELDHIVPFALGGDAQPSNLRLHCTALAGKPGGTGAGARPRRQSARGAWLAMVPALPAGDRCQPFWRPYRAVCNKASRSVTRRAVSGLAKAVIKPWVRSAPEPRRRTSTNV